TGKKTKKSPETPTNDAFDSLSIETKQAATVVLMLNSPEEEVLLKASEAILRFAEKGDVNRSSLLSLGALEPLLSLISHEDKLIRKNAFMALGSLASHGDVKLLLKKNDAVPQMVAKLSHEDDVVILECATLCLALLSTDFGCKVQIFDNKGMEALIRLLTNPHPNIKKNSVECIYNLVQDSQSLVAVCKLKGISPLLELLHTDVPAIQDVALHTLECITVDRETQSLLMTIFLQKYSDLHALALKVVCNCLGDSGSVPVIEETGVLEKLLQFVVTSNLHEVQASAIKAISRVARSCENRKILQDKDVEKVLVDLLAVENSNISSAACQTVAVMSENLANGIMPIVQLLNSENAEVQEAAAQALSSLTTGNQPNAQVVDDAKGDVLLIRCLQSGNPNAVAHAAITLANMASHESLRDSILSHGAMQALVPHLQYGEKHLIISITQAVASLACDAEGRMEFRNTGGLPPLIKLLLSNDAEVRRNGCWAVSVCASDEPTATEMCKLGALEILQELNLSTSRKNKFSELALQKLLDNNLSVKYSLTGHLSPSDIITDGFYDPGQVQVGHRVPALEDLSKQAVNQHRPVIAKKKLALSQQFSRQQSFFLYSEENQKDRKESERQPWTLPCDVAFHNMVTEAAKTILPLQDDTEQYRALAKLVSDAMGGAVNPDELHNFLFELHLSELKHKHQSNIIPIGRIRKGTYYHRAMLFKALADRIGLVCSLVRGSYNRAWNEVFVSRASSGVPGYFHKPQSYIVDLMHDPGNLMRNDSLEAAQYQSI
uniref:EDR1/CTR1/ARMC3-like peptidase-like domain-containing protein n=1 Tax=Denticeps clupeoides TaxID=299321 RepID=A0AAY4EZP8_9TELE